MKTLSDLMLVYHAAATGFAEGPYCKDYAAMKEAIQNFQPIIERNVAKEGACQEDWQLLQLHSAYTSLFVQVFEMMERGEEEKKIEAAKQLIDLIRRNELAAQKVLDVHNTSRVLQGRWKLNNFEV